MNAKRQSFSEPSGFFCAESRAIRLNADYEKAFSQLITERTGIALQTHQLANLRSTVIKACHHFSYPDCGQLLKALQAAQDTSPQLDFLICGVTVGESYFFRDNAQIELLRTRLLPGIIAQKRAKADFTVRIWSSGCSQGQEIYTMAMLLLELLPDIEDWRLMLLGTDINHELLSKAMRGCYSEWSFRALSPAQREQWFSHKSGVYELHPKIRSMVRFSRHNLSNAHYASICEGTDAMDVILCRNVFIYLDSAAIRHAMGQYAECLSEHGVLLLGASDPIDYKHTTLTWVQEAHAAYFKKSSPTLLTHFFACEQSFRLNDAQTRPFPLKTTPTSLSPAAPLPFKSAELSLLLAQADWQGVLEKVGHRCETSEHWLMKAKAFTGMGHCDLALEACERSLALNPVNKHAYLIRAMVFVKKGQDLEAEATLRKALYLDHAFIEAHYEMAQLKIRSRQWPSAIKCLEIALKLVLQSNPDSLLLNVPGGTYRVFSKTLVTEIALLRECVAEKK